MLHCWPQLTHLDVSGFKLASTLTVGSILSRTAMRPAPVDPLNLSPELYPQCPPATALQSRQVRCLAKRQRKRDRHHARQGGSCSTEVGSGALSLALWDRQRCCARVGPSAASPPQCLIVAPGENTGPPPRCRGGAAQSTTRDSTQFERLALFPRESLRQGGHSNRKLGRHHSGGTSAVCLPASPRGGSYRGLDCDRPRLNSSTEVGALSPRTSRCKPCRGPQWIWGCVSSPPACSLIKWL